MTSTGFNAGLGDLNRNSSRILKPPGGGHSDIFGTEMEEKPRKQNKNQMISNIFGNIEEKKLVTDCTPRKMSSIPIGTDINDENQTPAKWKPPPTLPGYDSVSELPKEISRKLETSHAPGENNSEKNVKLQRNRVPPGGYSSALW